MDEPHPLHPVRAPAPDGPLDRLVWYIYSNFRHLLTEEEWDVYMMWVSSRKLMHTQLRNVRLSPWYTRALEIATRYPAMVEQLNRDGYGSVLMAAAQRVLREHGERNILHRCEKCGGLCRTPKAQQCFDCGYDWHPPEQQGTRADGRL